MRGKGSVWFCATSRTVQFCHRQQFCRSSKTANAIRERAGSPWVSGHSKHTFQEKQRGELVRFVSARSSLRRLILSFSPSASRLAAVILACICSPLISAAIIRDPWETEGGNWGVTVGTGEGIERVEARRKMQETGVERRRGRWEGNQERMARLGCRCREQ